MKVFRRVGQTKFIKDGLKGLLTIHDGGSMAVSVDHKHLFNDLQYQERDSYYVIDKPSTKEREVIMDRLFDFNQEQESLGTGDLNNCSLPSKNVDMKSSAELSQCRKYRYALWRTWDENKGTVMFIGLNPSTADETADDATIKRCISYAKQWKYGGIVMANLFAYRTSSPNEMMQAEDPIGMDNDKWLKRLSKQVDIVVAMWGNKGSFDGRAEEVIKLIPDLQCLRVTMQGQPHHTRGLPDGIKYSVYTSGTHRENSY